MNRTTGLVHWWRSLGDDPVPLAPGEKLAAWIVSAVAALSRVFALARTPWDWDEALFMSALRHFDVTAHHPHPPGFPLFIATARLFTLAGLGPFHALQAISFLSAIAIVPAMLLLGQELRASFRVSLIAGVFLAFFPNVWVFGGTAFSDVPSMTLVIVAAALLLRGCRSDAALYGGAIVLAIAAGYRPQNLAIGFAPAMIVVIRSFSRRWIQLLIAALIGAAIVAAAYGAAAHLSGGWETYRDTVRAHQQYITTVDSFRNPLRPPLWRLFDKFFVRPYRVTFVNVIVTLLVAIGAAEGLARLRASVLVMLAAFGPFCVVAWLILDHFSVSRFSIGYAPLMAWLAAEGLHVLFTRLPQVEAFATFAIAAAISIWIWPALREVRRHPSPPAVAAAWIHDHVRPGTATLYVHGSMQPLIEALLPGFPYVATGDAVPAATAATRGHDMFVFEGTSTTRGAVVFRRAHRRLAAMVRDRYFEVSIVPVEQIIAFGPGWYDEEGAGTAVWRWMGQRAECSLPPVHGRGRLALNIYVPLDALGAPPDIDVILNGVRIDRIHASAANVERSYVVPSRGNAPNDLVLETDRVVNPAARGLGGDARNLGLRLSAIEWSQAK